MTDGEKALLVEYLVENTWPTPARSILTGSWRPPSRPSGRSNRASGTVGKLASLEKALLPGYEATLGRTSRTAESAHMGETAK